MPKIILVATSMMAKALKSPSTFVITGASFNWKSSQVLLSAKSDGSIGKALSFLNLTLHLVVFNMQFLYIF